MFIHKLATNNFEMLYSGNLQQEKYRLTIRDRNQPMLISNLKSKDVRGGQQQEVLLVPELCQATGLTDEMRANFRCVQ